MTEYELDLESNEDAAPALPVMDLLPPSFALPLLTQFVPNPQLREAVHQAAIAAAGVDVRGPEGLATADVALDAVREAVKAVKAAFEEPAHIAYQLHKALTDKRADWIEAGEAAIAIVGRRIYVEQQRLKALEQEARRKAQADADAQARLDAQRRIDEAAQQEAAPEVIEQLQEEAKTASAPPVHIEPTAGPLQSTTIVENWTSTVKGTPHEDEVQQPRVEDATEAQRDQLKVLMQAVLAGAPIVCVTWNWKGIDKLVQAGKSSFKVPGIDSYNKGGVKAKPRRKK
jgi:hypothetical protein